MIGLAAVLVLGGASAAAYFGIIVPNQPANVLRTAVVNSLKQQQVSSSGSFEGSPAFGNGVAYKATFSSASNLATKALDLKLNLTVSGVTLPVETRLVNNNFYFEIGDLSTISDLVNTFSPGAGTLVQSVSSDLSNKWVVVDSTILDEDGTLKCFLNTNWTLTNADLQLLQTQYAKQPFTTIQSTSSATVDGRPAEKFVLSIDDDKSAAYADKLFSNLSVVKNLEKCPGASSSSSSPAASALSDHHKTPLTIWVDKGTKRIVQIGASSTGQSNSDVSSVTLDLHYGNVSVAAPANAEPVLQVFSQIANSAKSNPALTNLLNSGGMAGTSGSSSSGLNLLSQ